MSKLKTLLALKIETVRFNKRLDDAIQSEGAVVIEKTSWGCNKVEPRGYKSSNAALKRASLDLTKALVTIRKPNL